METPIIYTPNWLREEAADAAFIQLWDELAWVRHDKVPRREYYVHAADKPYSYGIAEYARTYESQPMHPVLLQIWMKAEAQYGHAFETCFLNGYEDGKDFLGWHSDNSPEMDDARPILIVTLGAEREIWFRRNSSEIDAQIEKFKSQHPDFGPEAYESFAANLSEVDKLKLGHGSLCEMKPGMQDTHQHRIPKAGFENCGPRISLTFRGYVAS